MPFENVDSADSLLKSGLVGRFRQPSGKARNPALLVLGGSEGGLQQADELAEQFAAEGFATLGLAYFGLSPLPNMLEEIPLEYFHKAVDWLREVPDVDGTRVGVVGGSKGGEAALLIGSTAPRVRAVVAYVPSHVAWQALNWQPPPRSSWSHHREPIPFVRYVKIAESMKREGLRGLYAASLEAADANTVRAAEIPVERTQGAVLLVSGGQDGVWPSSEMARSIVERLRANHFVHAYQHLDYPDAGHAIMGLASVPETVKAPWWGELHLGGTDSANAAARFDAFSKVVSFLTKQMSAEL